MKYLKVIFFLVCFVFFSCKKETVDTNNSGSLNFSNDTITFDTVFASVGSITKILKVYNNNENDIYTDIELKGVSAANFRINIDGVPSNSLNNVNIPSKDSIFIFIEVTINPSNNTLPYILSDSLVFTSGSKKQSIKLIAWGQDAYFHTANTYGEILSGSDTIRFYYHQINSNETWTNDKPHVIYGYVVIEPNCILNINPGANIYLHHNSGIIVGNPFNPNFGGTIKINGELGNEVTFQGDRLDQWYKELPGQWDRIWMMPGSINNEINYAIIKNGTIGIHADSVANNNPTVKISNSIIENMSSIGILGQGATINAENLLINECGQYTLACNIGGTYDFTHCTFANYWNYNSRKNPSILLNNYYEGIDGNIYSRNLEKAKFTNCIIYGSLSNEISFQEDNSANFNYDFDHCLIRLENSPININSSNFKNCIINQNPIFLDPYYKNYKTTQQSPANNSGTQTNVLLDIEGNFRTNPDIGVYEFQD